MQRKSIYNITVSYLLFFLSVIIMLIPLYIYNFNILSKREKDITAEMLKNGAKVLNQNLESLSNINQITCNDYDYRQLTYKYYTDGEINYSLLARVQDNFTGLMSAQNLITDAGIIYKDSYVITRYRNFAGNTMEDFYKNYFRCCDNDYEQWRRDLTEESFSGILSERTYWSYDFKNYNALTFYTNWSITNNGKSGIFYATINTNTLLSQLVTEEISQAGYVVIYSANEEVLFSHQYSSSPGYNILTYKIPQFSLKIEVGIPDTLVSNRLAPVRRLIIIYSVIMFLLAVMLAGAFAFKNTKPLRALVGLLHQTPAIGQNASSPVHNEYDYIAHTVTYLKNTIQDHTVRLRNHIFEKAISNGLHNQNSLIEFNSFFPDFPEHYQLALICFDSTNQLLLEQLVTEQISVMDAISQISPQVNVYTILNETTAVILLPVESVEASLHDHWVPKLESLSEKISSLLKTEVHIALSQSFNHCRSLSEAFSQVQNIMLISDTDNTIPVWQLKNFPQKPLHVPMDFSSMQQLYNALLTGDLETTLSLLQYTIAALQTNGLSDELIIQQVFYNIRNVLLRIKLEHYEIMGAVAIPPYQIQGNISRMFEVFSSCCENICTIVLEAKEANKAKYSDDICKYIKDNLSNDMLYAKMAASEFGISETTLQKVIRNATGKSFFEYVEDLRLEKAKNLLKTTDENINAISAACGFSSHNSFYKAFKRRYSMSPSAVREVSS